MRVKHYPTQPRPDSIQMALVNLQLKLSLEKNTKLDRIRMRREKSLRPGLIYFKLDPVANLIKIGFTNNLKRRSAELNRTNNAELKTLGVIRAGFRYEARLHRMFSSARWYGEWFHPSRLLMTYIALFTESPRK